MISRTPFMIVALGACLVHAALESGDGGCAYPCKLNHGCVCAHATTHTGPDGQTYGTCSSCDAGWRGWDCNTVNQECLNEGMPIGDRHCLCPLAFRGPHCEHRVCVHSSNGSTALPAPATNDCGSCANGWYGVQCDMCHAGANATCTDGSRCGTAMVPTAGGTGQTYECDMTTSQLVQFFSGGREGVRIKTKLSCATRSGWGSGAADGSCTLTLWRVEPQAVWTDAFFHCTLLNCTGRSDGVACSAAACECAPDPPSGDYDPSVPAASSRSTLLRCTAEGR